MLQIDFEPVEISAGIAIQMMQLLIEGYAEPDIQRNVREVCADSACSDWSLSMCAVCLYCVAV